MILKPANQTPLTALALAELAIRAGVPEGVLSVLTGDSKQISAPPPPPFPPPGRPGWTFAARRLERLSLAESDCRIESWCFGLWMLLAPPFKSIEVAGGWLVNRYIEAGA